MSVQLSDFSITKFHGCDATTRSAFETFVRGLTLALDNEPGDDPDKGTWVWVKEQDATMADGKPFATFIFRDKDSGAIQATASFVADDRGVANKLGLDKSDDFLGIWGFFLVQRDIRRQGIGAIISKYVDDHVQQYVDECGSAKTVYLFTANEHAMRIYERLGFESQDETVNLPEFDFDEHLFAKRYEPRSKGAVKAA